MYGVIGKRITNHEKVIYGENEKIYDLNANDLNLDVNDCITLSEYHNEQGECKAQIESKLIPKKVDKELLAKLVKDWDQDTNKEEGNGQLFIATDDYRELVSNKKILFVLGRKGAGKTAVATHLLKESNVVGKIHSFANFPFTRISTESDKHSFTRIKLIWKVVFLALALKSVAESGKCTKAQKKIINRYYATQLTTPYSWKRFCSYFTLIVGMFKVASSVHPVGWAFTSGITLVEAIIERSGNSAGKNSSSNEGDAILGNEVETLESLYKSLKFKLETLVIFDQLDEEYVQKKSFDPETYSEIVRGLFNAAVEINALNIGIRPLAILREDIYKSFVDPNKTKLSSHILKLQWSEDDLTKVITHRLGFSFDRTGDSFEELWLSIFMPCLVDLNGNKSIYRSSFKWFMHHTSLTPRDCVELIRYICKEILSSGKDRCDLTIFSTAARKMGKLYMLPQVYDATQISIPKLEDIFQTIKAKADANPSGISSTLGVGSLAEIIGPLENVNSLIESLYEVGSIGMIEGKNKKGVWLDGESFSINNGQVFFHPAVALALNLSPFSYEGTGSSSKIYFGNLSPSYRRIDIQNKERRDLIVLDLSKNLFTMRVNDETPNKVRLYHQRFPEGCYCISDANTKYLKLNDTVNVSVTVVNFPKSGWAFRAKVIPEDTPYN